MDKKTLLKKAWVHRTIKLPPDTEELVMLWNEKTVEPGLVMSKDLRKIYEQLNYSENMILGEEGMPTIRNDLSGGNQGSSYFSDYWFKPVGPY